MDGKQQFGKICPACGYRRKPQDSAPTWQCPRCQVVYEKVANNVSDGQALKAKQTKILHHYRLIQNKRLFIAARCVEFLFLGALILFAIAYLEKGKLPLPHEINPQLLQAPIQIPLKKNLYHFDYRGFQVDVKPVASYELWGLIVSQNDIDGFIDGYDPDSVNLKDICVIWGENLETPLYQQVEFWNRTWTCHFQYGPELRGVFQHHMLSNNHLLSDNPKVRQAIRHLRVGDQVHVRGQLVNYKTPKLYGWRNTSTVRTDTGNGACEVFLVDDIQVLKQGTPGWYQAYDSAKKLLILCLILRILLQVWDVLIAKS